MQGNGLLQKLIQHMSQLDSILTQKRKGNRVRFIDSDLFPFFGPYYAKRLKDVPVDYWRKYIVDNAHIKPRTYKGLIIAYAKRRIRTYDKQHAVKRYVKIIWINNGLVEKRHEAAVKIPDGFTKGRLNSVVDRIAKIQTQKRQMKKHTRIYFSHFGYDYCDKLMCELTGLLAVDIHHIQARGMGGSKKADVISNLMALHRIPHDIYGDITKYKDFLNKAHEHFMKTQQPYIQHNPEHQAFEALKSTELSYLLKQRP